MNSFFYPVFFVFLAVANAGVLVGPSARIIQGPSTRTTVVGPDGSAISSVAPGGQIVQQESAGLIAQSAPVVAAPALAYSVPTVARTIAVSAPVLSAYSAPVVSAYSAPVLSAYSAPVLSAHGLAGLESTVVAGPSGTISTGRSLTSPVISAW